MECCFVFALSLICIGIAIYDIRVRIIANKALILLLAVKTVWLVLDISFLDATPLMFISAGVGALLMAVACRLAWRFSLKGNAFVGAGDYKYLVVLGYCVGFEGIHIFSVSAALALLIHWLILLILKKQAKSKPIAAAPYLSIGAITAMIAGYCGRFGI